MTQTERLNKIVDVLNNNNTIKKHLTAGFRTDLRIY